jgi:hypothetical protein
VRRAARLLAVTGAAALAVLSWRCGDTGGPSSDGVEAAAVTITAADVARWIGALADDSMRGRQTPSPEIDGAARVIQDHFTRLGLDPLFGYAYQQFYSIPKASAELAPNVGAMRRGRDPALRGQYVLYVAHMDHLGVSAAGGGDSIFNGADDNASGTSAVIEIAEALAALDSSPRRSVAVLLVSGEEHGFWGSIAFVDAPPMALGTVVAVLNLDMVSRNHADSVGVAGLDLSTLGDVVRDAAGAHPEDHLAVTWSAGGLSDQVPFDVHGIPWLLFHAGLHANYHTPSDEPALCDADKAARVARLAFRTGMAVANAAARPTALGSRP